MGMVMKTAEMIEINMLRCKSLVLHQEVGNDNWQTYKSAENQPRFVRKKRKKENVLGE